MMAEENKMREIRVAKVTVNMGVGQPGEGLKNAQTILEMITGTKSVQTQAKVRLPTWNIRPGLPIGAKTTLRKQKAQDFLKRAFLAKSNTLKKKNFDKMGNFGFGIREHIDLQGIKYDPKMGIRGFDVLVSLERPGYRVSKRKLGKGTIGRTHVITRDEGIAFVEKKFGVKVND
ncbi:MAG: 50S ribosomal protein L5 [Candidatus Diapherotrites archaeon]|uniref:Large ribosomal subunit protein uL5 n=1 Tax=Candidatus Iainarchaeum sp. TaxID=3101447 RepID=A0A8T4LBJ5_9ARCH|nr:50S ribosomal protein L5 [Candidatus Diapherotrites archaeon]